MDKNKGLNKNQWTVLILSAVCVICGILFCIFSQSMVEFLRTVICVVVLIYGAFYLVSYSVLSLEDKDVSALIQAVLAIGLGLFVIFIPSFFVMAICFMIIICGLAKLYNVVKAKKENNVLVKDKLVIGVTECVIALALVVLCNTPVPALLVNIYLGVMLILEGVTTLIRLWLEINGAQYKLKTTDEVEEQSAETVETTVEEKK